jgi:serine/threonine protein kinase
MPEYEDELRARAQSLVGVVLSRKYRIEGVLGVGGMATVFAAAHRNGRRVALKLLHPEFSSRSDVRVRFLREGQAANAVNHPGVVTVIDDDVAENGAAFLVMEFLEGRSLEELWEEEGGRLPPKLVLAVGRELCEVLDAAHVAGVIHRDLKPANLFLTKDGRLKVLDFGLAQLRDAAAPKLTATGLVFGTPAFMAPEQAKGRNSSVDAQTDLWAVGATMFTLLSGEMIHAGRTGQELIIAAATKPPRSLWSVLPTADAELVELIDRAVAFKQKARWSSAREMREAICRVSDRLFGDPRPELVAPAEMTRVGPLPWLNVGEAVTPERTAPDDSADTHDQFVVPKKADSDTRDDFAAFTVRRDPPIESAESDDAATKVRKRVSPEDVARQRTPPMGTGGAIDPKARWHDLTPATAHLTPGRMPVAAAHTPRPDLTNREVEVTVRTPAYLAPRPGAVPTGTMAHARAMPAAATVPRWKVLGLHAVEALLNAVRDTWAIVASPVQPAGRDHRARLTGTQRQRSPDRSWGPVVVLSFIASVSLLILGIMIFRHRAMSIGVEPAPTSARRPARGQSSATTSLAAPSPEPAQIASAPADSSAPPTAYARGNDSTPAAAESPPPSPSASPSSARAGQPRPAAPTTASSATMLPTPSPACAPPFVRDSAGVKHWKLECL